MAMSFLKDNEQRFSLPQWSFWYKSLFTGFTLNSKLIADGFCEKIENLPWFWVDPKDTDGFFPLLSQMAEHQPPRSGHYKIKRLTITT
jgi:hypothetical protein